MKHWIVTYKIDGGVRKTRLPGVNEDSAKFFLIQLIGCKESDIIKVRQAAATKKNISR